MYYVGLHTAAVQFYGIDPDTFSYVNEKYYLEGKEFHGELWGIYDKMESRFQFEWGKLRSIEQLNRQENRLQITTYGGNYRGGQSVEQLEAEFAQMAKSPHVLTMTEPVVILPQLTSDKNYIPEEFPESGNIFESWPSPKQPHGSHYEFHITGMVKSNYTYVNGSIEGDAYEYDSNQNCIAEHSYRNNVIKKTTRYYPNGNLKAEQHYLGGQLEGEVKEYYLTGELLSEAEYSRGQKNGAFLSYFREGGVRIRATYRNDRELEKSLFDNSGTLLEKCWIEKSSDGVEQSLKEEYFTDGTVRERLIDCRGLQEIESYFPGGSLRRKKQQVIKKNPALLMDSEKAIQDEHLQMVLPYVEYYVNGNRKEEGSFRNLLKYGERTTYHVNGQIKSRTFFNERGVTHGLKKSFYENGNPETEHHFNDNVLDGPFLTWHSNGELSEETFFVQGRKEGTSKYYNRQGVLTYECELDKGSIVGSAKHFYDNGVPSVTQTHGVQGQEYTERMEFYPNGQVHKRTVATGNKAIPYLHTDYYSNGNRMQEHHLDSDDQIHGETKFFREDGSLEVVNIRVHGTNHGKDAAVWYDREGNVTYKCDFENGEKHGSERFFYSSGEMKSEVSYLTGKKHGPYRRYHRDGSLSRRGEYLRGELHGTYEEFYEDGLPLILTTYQNGNIHGDYFEYYPDGTTKVYCFQRHDTDERPAKYHYFEDGSLRQLVLGHPNDANYLVQTFDMLGNTRRKLERINIKTELITEYYKDGTLKLESIYKGENTVERRYYRSNGNLLRTETLVDGKLNGIVLEFGKENAELSRTMYENGTVGDYQFYKFHPDGELREIGCYLDGFLEDFHKTFYPSGALKSRTRYRDRALYWEPEEYYENGALKSEYEFDEDAQVMYYKEYYENERLKVKAESSNGHFHGEYEYYFPGGEIKVEANYFRGLLDGPRCSYYKSGQIRTHEEFVFGKPIEPKQIWYPDGTKQLEEEYDQDGHLTKITRFNREGTISSVETYENGMLTDEIKLFYPTGETYGTIPVEEGEKSGEALFYYKNGALLAKQRFCEGFLHGEVLEYYESGAIKMRGSYQYEKREGEQVFYDETGAVERSDLYVDGMLICSVPGSEKE